MSAQDIAILMAAVAGVLSSFAAAFVSIATAIAAIRERAQVKADLLATANDVKAALNLARVEQKAETKATHDLVNSRIDEFKALLRKERDQGLAT
jgi:hypothetical protein